MKKIFLSLVVAFLLLNSLYAQVYFDSMEADYSLIPQTCLSDFCKYNLEKLHKINYCYQSVVELPKSNYFLCDEILQNKIDTMGGGVDYYNIVHKVRKPIFTESKYNKNKNMLYVKDKTFGKLYFDTEFYQHDNICTCTAVLNKKLENFLFRAIKPGEFTIFIMTVDKGSSVVMYLAVQTSFKLPVFFRRHIINAFWARLHGINNWFIRMYTTGKHLEN